MPPKKVVTMENVDLESQEEIVSLFPFYAREKYRLFNETKKPLSKKIEITFSTAAVTLSMA